jgi:hypothetical protein
MRITSTPEQLTLRDNPGCFWFLGLFFIAVGLPFIAGPLGLFTNNNEVSLPVKAFAVVMGCIAVGVGVHLIYEAPVTATVFDRLTGEAVIKERGLFKNSARRIALAEIKSTAIDEKKDSDGDPIYRPLITLHDQQTVLLSSLWIHDKEATEEVVRAVQDFLDLKKE